MKTKTDKSNQIFKLSDLAKDILNIDQKVKTWVKKTVNVYLVIRNWLIGKRIHEDLLTNRSDDYGKKLIKSLSSELSKYGKGFGESNLTRFHKFYLEFNDLFKFKDNIKIYAPMGHECILPWSFYKLLLPVKDKTIRDWYAKEAMQCGWSERQLLRNIKTNYYQRVLSNQIPHKSNKPTQNNSRDFIKSIYIFDFVGLEKDQKYNESDLENALIEHLKDFILELGKGYSFIGNQIHLRYDSQDYFIDLVFYNTILKSNILIDLKVGKICPDDIGQMLIYLDLFDKQRKQPSDNPSIGIILSSDNDNVLIKYLAQNTQNNIVSSKYLTYLPTKQELKDEIDRSLRLLGQRKVKN